MELKKLEKELKEVKRQLDIKTITLAETKNAFYKFRKDVKENNKEAIKKTKEILEGLKNVKYY